MSIVESVSLFGIMVALAAMPSTSVALVVARSAALGVGNGIAVAVGIVSGDLVFIILAISGLSAIAEAMGGLFLVVKTLGGLYLVWFGFSLLTSKGREISKADRLGHKRSLVASWVAGFVVTLGDIKAIIFYASLLPLFVDLSNVKTAEIFVVMLITLIGVGGVKVVYAVFAREAAAYVANRNLESKARKTAGGLLVGAGGYLIAKG